MIEIKKKLSWDDLMFSLLMLDRTPFMFTFWGDDMIIPPSRKDLPPDYLEYKHVVTEEVVMMWQDTSPKKLFCTSRKIGKTLYLEAINIQDCVTYTGGGTIECMFFAPGEHQIDPVLNRLHSRVMRVPLFDTMLQNWNAGDGIVNWKNGVIMHLRIEGKRGGQNMIGLRAGLYILGDEMAYGSQAAYDERQNTSTPTCPITYCGVPNGDRTSPFYKLDQTSMGRKFSRHKLPITANPMYHSLEAMTNEFEKHGRDQNAQSWVTQVLGLWGEESVSSFPVIPINKTIKFRHASIVPSDLENGPEVVEEIVSMPALPAGVKALRYIIYGDIGYSPSPTELGIAAEIEDGVWQQLVRVSMLRIDMPMQAALIDAINRHVLPMPASCIGIDAHGQGSGVLQGLHSELNSRFAWYPYKGLAFDVGFAGTIEQTSIQVHKKCGQAVRMGMDGILYCDSCRMPVWSEAEVKHPKLQAKQVYTTELKLALSEGGKWLEAQHFQRKALQDVEYANREKAMLLAQDEQTIEDLQLTTEQQAPNGYTIRYIPPAPNQEHRTDSLRAFVATIRKLDEMSEPDDDWLSHVRVIELGVNRFG